MSKATLVIMAAGMGSRFGGGIKQLAPVGPGGEIIMDYSIYDAVRAGFDKVVFVIRKDLEEPFREAIGKRIEKYVDVAYAYQEVNDIPEKYREKFSGRTKPWGTGQAILCCRDIIKTPFLVINADDYYGREAYRAAYAYLTSTQKNDKMSICMVSFVLKNTLSDNGGVTRGVCRVGEDGMLAEIIETHNITKSGNSAVAEKDGHTVTLDLESPVSMNMWGLNPGFFSVLAEEFERFLSETDETDLKSEYLLPVLVGKLLKEEKIRVKVLRSEDEWFGVTYKEDRENVTEAINRLIEKEIYPSCLYT